MFTMVLALASMFWLPLAVWAGPRLLHPLGSEPLTVWGTYQEDVFGNQLPLVLELYTRVQGEVVRVDGLGNSEGIELVFVGPDGHIVHSRVANGRPRLTYINSGRRGWGVLMVHDAQGAISHRDVQLRYSRRLGGELRQQYRDPQQRIPGSGGAESSIIPQNFQSQETSPWKCNTCTAGACTLTNCLERNIYEILSNRPLKNGKWKMENGE